MLQPTRRSIRLADGAVSCLEWRGEGPALNFAHANGFNAGTYKSLLAPLTDEFHVFALDQRGHGFSTLPATPGLAKGWTVFRDDLLAYLARIADAPVILAGHSMGATASLMAAAAAPHLVRALVLFEPVLDAPIADPDADANANPGPDLAARTLKRRDTFASLDAALKAYRGRGIFKSWPDAMVEAYLRGGLVPLPDGTLKLSCTPAWESECFREVPICVSGVARDVRCPIAIVHGTVDSTSVESEIAAITAARPDTRVARVEGASHFLPMERADIVHAEIRRMRDRIESAEYAGPSESRR